MLLELNVRDLAIIEEARLELSEGFNVLTGETGAGKSLLIDAVSLLLGDRADSGIVRAGAERAVVQGVFSADAELGVAAALAELGVPGDDTLIVDREVHAAGRSVARLNGRVVPVRALADIGAHLVDLHGQSETADLRREAEHGQVLDAYAGLLPARAELATQVAALLEVRGALAQLHDDEAAQARRADALAFQLGEIDAARVREGEEEELAAERLRLANAERLALLAEQAYAALQGVDGEGPAGVDAAQAAAAAVDDLARIDPSLADVAARLNDAAVALAEATHDVRAYRDAVEFNPDRLEEVERRLSALADLKRKYGGSEVAVIAWAEAARTELEGLTHAGERAERLATDAARLRADVGTRAEDLARKRAAAAAGLEQAVVAEMAELALANSSFSVELERRPDPDGVPVDGELVAFDATGVDRVRFLVSTNPGEPPRPLAKVASGGEAARIMLGLKSVLGGAAGRVLIFDEIDAGIGGRVAEVVGRKLWCLSRTHQVLCVTHLPQVAAYADAHTHVTKDSAGGRTVTRLRRLTPAERPEELRAMLGTRSEPGLASAQALMDDATTWKAEMAAPA